MKLLIKNGHVLDPASGKDGIYDILIQNERILRVENQIEEEADQRIDAKGLFVMPGFVDLHVHLREPGFEYKETIHSGSLAAAKGGFTSICPMPNTNPVIDNQNMIEYLLQKAKEEAVVNIWPIGAMTKGQNGIECADIIAMGTAGAKAFSEDGKSVMDSSLYLEGMKLARQAKLPVFAHCEDKTLVGNGVINAGKKADQLGFAGIPNAVEDIIVARDILLAKEAKVKLHLCHCSTKDSVAFVKLAKEWGQDVTAEVCPHHFILTDEDIKEDNANYKMNPPLRKKEDVQALKEGLKNNIMDVIATDHAPHSKEEKEQSIHSAPFGIVGMETAFALTVTELVEPGYLTRMQMVEKLSFNPAKIIKIDRGSLEPGKIADIVLADLCEEYRIDASSFLSKGKNTPFQGKIVRGRILKTIVGGKVVYKSQEYNSWQKSSL